jgi:hypothetical protein
MRWLRVDATDKQREYVNQDSIVKVAFVADEEGNERATVYVAGSGEQLTSVGQVSDPEMLQELRGVVGELPGSLPHSEGVPRRPA